MELLADVVLAASAVGAGVYCYVLSRRLRKFNDLERGIGGAIAALSERVDQMTHTLEGARMTASESSSSLSALTERADGVSQRLELLVASLHDLPLGDRPEKAQTQPKSAPNSPSPAQPKAEAGHETPVAFIRSGLKSDTLVLRSSNEAS